MIVITSPTELAKTLEVSQQTTSRHLIELEREGYITRHTSIKGIEVKISEKGRKKLREVYLTLKAAIDTIPSIIIIEGTITSGLGEGAYYISQKQYKIQFQRNIGFTPYSGTLNIQVSPSELAKKKELETFPPILIQGFERRNRLFGDVRCYPVRINDSIDGAIIMIDRTHHNDSVIEVIAPVHLRSELKLEDGERISLTFSTTKFPPKQSLDPVLINLGTKHSVFT